VQIRQYESNSQKERVVKWEEGAIKKMKEGRTVLVNLKLMTISWCCVSFSYFTLTFFIKYLPGDVYMNQSISGLSTIAFLFAGPMSRRLDNKITLTLSFFIAFLSSLVMMIFIYIQNANDHSQSQQNSTNLSIFILMIRGGVNLAFCFVYVIHTELFPSSMLAISYGFCNFFCRGITLLAPIIAELENRNIPMIALTTACLLGAISSISLR